MQTQKIVIVKQTELWLFNRQLLSYHNINVFEFVFGQIFESSFVQSFPPKFWPHQRRHAPPMMPSSTSADGNNARKTIIIIFRQDCFSHLNNNGPSVSLLTTNVDNFLWQSTGAAGQKTNHETPPHTTPVVRFHNPPRHTHQRSHITQHSRHHRTRTIIILFGKLCWSSRSRLNDNQ